MEIFVINYFPSRKSYLLFLFRSGRLLCTFRWISISTTWWCWQSWQTAPFSPWLSPSTRQSKYFKRSIGFLNHHRVNCLLAHLRHYTKQAPDYKYSKSTYWATNAVIIRDWESMLINLPIPYNLCVPISRLLTIGNLVFKCESTS